MTESIEVRPVAVYTCDFPLKFGLPRQSGLASELRGRVVLLPAFQNPDYLRGIEGYSHLWLLWHCSLSPEAQSPTVRPPKLGGNTRVGVFASRSPVRPNPIGLSCVRLESVDRTEDGALCLNISGADLADGTPILDIKPYLAYADAIPDAKSGFAKTEGSLQVEIDSALLDRITPEKRDALLQTLALDPRPGYQDDPQRVYYMRYGAWDVGFRVDGQTLRVVDIRTEAETPG